MPPRIADICTVICAFDGLFTEKICAYIGCIVVSDGEKYGAANNRDLDKQPFGWRSI